MLALPCCTTKSKLKNKCRNVRCIAPNDGVYVEWCGAIYLFPNKDGSWRSKFGRRLNRPMHAAMQPPEKGGTELPPRGVRLRMVCSSLGPAPSRGHGWIQFGVLVGFIFDLRLF